MLHRSRPHPLHRACRIVVSCRVSALTMRVFVFEFRTTCCACSKSRSRSCTTRTSRRCASWTRTPRTSPPSPRCDRVVHVYRCALVRVCCLCVADFRWSRCLRPLLALRVSASLLGVPLPCQHVSDPISFPFAPTRSTWSCTARSAPRARSCWTARATLVRASAFLSAFVSEIVGCCLPDASACAFPAVRVPPRSYCSLR